MEARTDAVAFIGRRLDLEHALRVRRDGVDVAVTANGGAMPHPLARNQLADQVAAEGREAAIRMNAQDAVRAGRYAKDRTICCEYAAQPLKLALPITRRRQRQLPGQQIDLAAFQVEPYHREAVGRDAQQRVRRGGGRTTRYFRAPGSRRPQSLTSTGMRSTAQQSKATGRPKRGDVASCGIHCEISSLTRTAPVGLVAVSAASPAVRGLRLGILYAGSLDRGRNAP